MIRDQADRTHQLARLRDLDDYEMADEDPDVRGWHVYAAGGQKAGQVDELIVDPVAMKVRYLDVDVESDLKPDDRHVLIPIGVATLDEREDHVNLPATSVEQIMTAPPYQGGPITRDEEMMLRTTFGDDTAAAGSDFYAHDHFDDQRFYQTRRRRGISGSADTAPRSSGNRPL